MASLGIEMDVSMQLPQSFTPAEPIFPTGVGRRVMSSAFTIMSVVFVTA